MVIGGFAVIAAMLEMSLLGDGVFTQHPSHSCLQSRDFVFKQCPRSPQTPDVIRLNPLFLASFSGSTTAAIIHSIAALTGMCIIPEPLWKGSGLAARPRTLLLQRIPHYLPQSGQLRGNMCQSNNNRDLELRLFMWSNHVQHRCFLMPTLEKHKALEELRQMIYFGE